jgi:hypothetical protein
VRGTEFDEIAFFQAIHDLILTKRFASRPKDLEDVLALVRWFRRRYATPAERLACARHAYAGWRLTRGDALHHSRQS